MLTFAQIMFVAALMLGCAGYWRIHLSKRGSASWDEIVAKLRPGDWSSVGGLWATYRNASVLVQLADYAAEHGGEDGLPEEVLEDIRTDAFDLRIRALTALAHRILSISSIKPGASIVS